MAITTAFCDTAKRDFLSGTHVSTHVYKLMLIKTGHTGTYNSGTQVYGQISGDEVANGNGYTTGGVTLTGITYAITSNTASIDWGDASWPASTISAQGAAIYNATQAASGVIAVFDFGGTVASTNGTFSVTIPAAGTGVVRIG